MNCVRKVPGGSQDRAVCVGSSFPLSGRSHRAHVLYQKSLSWSEESWEHGFAYRALQMADFFPSAEKSPNVDNLDDCEDTPCHSNLKQLARERRAFSLVWERLPQSSKSAETDPALVLGSIRRSFQLSLSVVLF